MKFTRFNSQYERQGEELDFPWARVAKRLSIHTVGTKDGSAITVGLFAGTRSTDNLVARTAIALDVETSKTTGEVPPDPQAVCERLRARHLASVVWTTYSHTPAEPRYRVLVPFTQPVLLDEVNFMFDNWFSPALARALDIEGVCDRTKFGAASLFYLPRIQNDSAARSAVIVPGLPLLPADAIRAARAAHDTDMQQQREELVGAFKMDPQVMETIKAFNDSHPVESLLDRYGYRRRGKRWKSPHQSPNSVGATEVRRDDGERWLSFSDSDAAAGVGQKPRRASQVMAFGDAFSLMRHYEARNDFRKALDMARNDR